MSKVEFSRTAKAPFEKRYGNFIGGKFVEPRSGKYFENYSPVNGRLLCEIARCRKIAQLDVGFHAQHRDLELQLALRVLAFVTRQLVQGLAGVAPR